MGEGPGSELVPFEHIPAGVFYHNMEHRLNRDEIVVGAIVRAYFSDFQETFLAGDVRVTFLDKLPDGLMKVTAELRVHGVDELVSDSDHIDTSNFIINRSYGQDTRQGFFGSTTPDAFDDALRALLANELPLVTV